MGTAYPATHGTPSTSVWVAGREDLSDFGAQSALSDLAIAIGAPEKCFLPGDSDEYYRHWQTWRGEKPCSGRPPAPLFSDFWRPSVICVCRRNSRNWTSLPV